MRIGVGHAHSFLYHSQRTAIADIALCLNGTGSRSDLLAVQEQRHSDGNTKYAKILLSFILKNKGVYTITG